MLFDDDKRYSKMYRLKYFSNSCVTNSTHVFVRVNSFFFLLFWNSSVEIYYLVLVVTSKAIIIFLFYYIVFQCDYHKLLFETNQINETIKQANQNIIVSYLRKFHQRGNGNAEF